MNIQFNHLRLFNFICSPFLVEGKFNCIKPLYNHSALFTSIVDAAIKVNTYTSAINPTFLKKEMTYGN